MDLDQREKVHNEGKGAKYTRARLPIAIVYSEEFDDWSSTLKREAEVKKYSRTKKLCLIGAK